MISVVIPNFNGTTLLKTYLHENMAIFKKNGITDVIVVDDYSNDDSVSYLNQHFSTIKVLTNSKNVGFSRTLNKGLRQAKHDIVWVLNNDMAINPDFDVDYILALFQGDPNCFSVVPTILRKNDKGILFDEAPNIGFFKGGWLSLEHSLDHKDKHKNESEFPVMWACGGAAFYRVDMLQKINYFDEELYSPFYLEDADVSYQAWKNGWKVLYTSHFTCFHQHQSTIGKYYSKAKVEAVHLRNYYLFHWKNLSDLSYIFSHIVTILIKMLTFQFKDILQWAKHYVVFEVL